MTMKIGTLETGTKTTLRWLALLATGASLSACATTVTPENAATFTDLSLCRIQANPGSREPAEMSLVFSDLDRRSTDCQAVFDAERRRVEEERRRQEELRRIAEEEARIRAEHQIERIAAVRENMSRRGSWNDVPVPPNTSGRAPNACLQDEESQRAWPIDAEAVMGDALNSALRTYEFNAYRQYVVVIRDEDDMLILQMDYAMSDPDDYVFGYARGVDEDGLYWGVGQISDYRGCR